MIVVAFLVGGIAGLMGAVATLLFTDLGWGVALAAYFGTGYGVPLVALAARYVKRPERPRLPQTQMVRR